jgi:hypothetical protein
MGYNTISSDNDLQYFFEPTSKVEPNIGYIWALELDYKLSSFFLLSTGIRYDANKGQHTTEAQVIFDGDASTHDFESATELDYVSIPINFKIGHPFGKHWVNIRMGPLVSFNVGKRISWTIDHQKIQAGESFVDANGNWHSVPEVDIDHMDLSFVVGLEYGYRLGANGFFISCNYENGLRNIVTAGPTGEAFNRSGVLLVGYRRFF